MLKQCVSGIGILLSMSGMAQAEYGNVSPWKIEADLGQSYYANAWQHDGKTALGRLSIGRELFFTPYGSLGLELGIQSGNTMRLSLAKETVDALGGVPIELSIKPSLDFLVDVQSRPWDALPLHTWLKGGVASRTMRLSNESIKGISDYSPEFQAGLGYRINEQATLNLGYQMIWGETPRLNVSPELEIISLGDKLPLQQAVLLGVVYHFW